MKLTFNKSILLFTIISLASCHSNQGKRLELITLIQGENHLTRLESGHVQKFRIQSPVHDLIKVNVNQCTYDIEIKFRNKKGDWVFIDSPSGNNSNESFLIEVFPDSDFIFEIYAIEPYKKTGYVELTYESQKGDADFHRRMQAERNYQLGCRKLFAPDKSTQNLAIEEFKSSIEIYHSIGDLELEAESLLKLGLAYYKTSHFLKAIDTCLIALNIYKNTGNIKLEAYLYNTIGASYQRIQNFDEALRYYYKTIIAWERSDKTSIISTTYSNISSIYFRKGYYQLSKFFLDLSFQTSKRGRNHIDFIIAHNQFGKYYFSNGQFDLSIEHFKKAHEIGLISKNFTNDAYALSTINLGRSYMQLNRYEDARVWAMRGIDAASKLNFHRTEAIALWSLGNIELHEGNLDLAKKIMNKALQKETKDWADNTYLSLAIATLFEALKEDLNPFAKAQRLDDAMSYIYLARQNDPDASVETQSFYWEARILWEKRNPAAIDQLSKGISNIEDKRNQTEDDLSQVSFFATQLHYYQLRLDILFARYQKTGKQEVLDDIFMTCEKIRARTLLDIINHQKPTPEGLPSSQDLLTYYRLLFEMEAHFNDNDILTQLEEKTLPLAKKIALMDMDRPLDISVAIQNARKIGQAIADPNTLLISYAFGLEKAYLLALDHQGLTVHDLGDFELLREKVIEICQFYQDHPISRRDRAPQSFRESMRELSHILLSPIKNLADYGRLVFIPDSLLQRVPFAALNMGGDHAPADSKRLVDQFEIAILPSASVWLALRNRSNQKKAVGNGLAIVANPVFNADDPRLVGNPVIKDSRDFLPMLPGTQKEAEGIAALTAEKTYVATGFAATRALVRSRRLEDYRYLHFATHGDIDMENPDRSSLIFSRFNERGQSIDGALRLSDIARLSLRADLVSLSACETAKGKIIRGEGLMSLARGFMAAGVPRVLGTLWRVPDDATTHFMTGFYRALLLENYPPAQALRQAQLAQRKQERWQDPYFWAGFVIIGDWQ